MHSGTADGSAKHPGRKTIYALRFVLPPVIPPLIGYEMAKRLVVSSRLVGPKYMAPGILRWGIGALWIVHGVWVLVNQLEGFLLGEALIGLAELAAAALIIQEKRGYDFLATTVSIVSGLLSALFLTKTPIIIGVPSAMALVAVLAMTCTISISAWDAIFHQGSRS
jgi:hypothetical protein